MIAGTFRAVLNAAGCIRAEGLFMMKDIEKQKRKVQVAIETVKILKDLDSKYELSVEYLRLCSMMPMSDEDMMKFRERYELTSGVWMLAQLKVMEEQKIEEDEV